MQSEQWSTENQQRMGDEIRRMALQFVYGSIPREAAKMMIDEEITKMLEAMPLIPQTIIINPADIIVITTRRSWPAFEEDEIEEPTWGPDDPTVGGRRNWRDNISSKDQLKSHTMRISGARRKTPVESSTESTTETSTKIKSIELKKKARKKVQ
ncbi:11786_t:CDS:2 [Paraglomus brasilianum]|uniref:11786_t:CDS:1 n=1 Tax=Paraglomus brasilianum TaxID=144538 RepID=A0A9N8ZEJ3_9GLOM|nr:11786_t:CDS:2 [Paraglomus brasilianum]